METETFSRFSEPTGVIGISPPQPQGAPPPRRTSIMDLLILLAERRRVVLLVTLACAVLAAIVAFLLPNEYTSTVLLLPPQQNSSLATQFLSAMGNMSPLAELAGSGLGLKNSNDMFVGMLKSQIVEDAMVNKFGLEREYRKRYLSEARKAFEKHVELNGSGRDGLIHISVEDRSPERAAQLANGYVDQFRALSQNLAVSSAGERALFFHQQLLQAKDKLGNAEEALKQTELSTGMIEISSQARALIESAASLRAQIAAEEVNIQALQTFAAGQNAQLVEAQQELASLRAQLAKLGGSEQSPDSLIVPRGKVPEAGLEYARRLRDVKYYETVFDILARQYELAKLDEAREGALIQIVSPAVVPDRKSSPHRGLIILAAGFFGLFLGSVIAIGQASLAAMEADPEGSARLVRLKSALRRKRRV
jgi:tyrosine-protein kinase Etk/Wzc